MLLRSAAVAQVGAAEDGLLERRLLAAGYETGIAARVMHRHISLLNIFDYPDYDLEKRNMYMSALNS